MVTSNKSKADSRTSSLTKETVKEMLVKGMEKGVQTIIDLPNKQCAEEKQEAATNWATDIKLARCLRQHDIEESQRQARDS